MLNIPDGGSRDTPQNNDPPLRMTVSLHLGHVLVEDGVDIPADKILCGSNWFRRLSAYASFCVS